MPVSYAQRSAQPFVVCAPNPRGPADTRSRSRGAFRPSFALRFTPSANRGRREGRVPAGTRKTPVRERCTRKAPERYRAAEHPAFPAQWFDGLYALSPETNSFLPPSPCESHGRAPVEAAPYSRGLTVATTARTTRFRRTRATLLRQKASQGIKRRSYNAACKSLAGVGSIHRPALHSHPRRRCQRPPQPDPRLVTTYDRPFSPDQDGRHIR